MFKKFSPRQVIDSLKAKEKNTKNRCLILGGLSSVVFFVLPKEELAYAAGTSSCTRSRRKLLTTRAFSKADSFVSLENVHVFDSPQHYFTRCFQNMLPKKLPKQSAQFVKDMFLPKLATWGTSPEDSTKASGKPSAAFVARWQIHTQHDCIILHHIASFLMAFVPSSTTRPGAPSSVLAPSTDARSP